MDKRISDKPLGSYSVALLPSSPPRIRGMVCVMVNFMCQYDWATGLQMFGKTLFWVFP